MPSIPYERAENTSFASDCTQIREFSWSGVTSGGSSSYYSPHRCKFNSKRQSSTLISKRQKGAPLSAPYSAYTKVGTFLLHKLVQRITPEHSCTPADSRRTNSSCGLSAEALVHFFIASPPAYPTTVTCGTPAMAHLSFPYKLVPWHSLIHRTHHLLLHL